MSYFEVDLCAPLANIVETIAKVIPKLQAYSSWHKNALLTFELLAGWSGG